MTRQRREGDRHCFALTPCVDESQGEEGTDGVVQVIRTGLPLGGQQLDALLPARARVPADTTTPPDRNGRSSPTRRLVRTPPLRCLRAAPRRALRSGPGTRPRCSDRGMPTDPIAAVPTPIWSLS